MVVFTFILYLSQCQTWLFSSIVGFGDVLDLVLDSRFSKQQGCGNDAPSAVCHNDTHSSSTLRLFCETTLAQRFTTHDSSLSFDPAFIGSDIGQSLAYLRDISVSAFGHVKELTNTISEAHEGEDLAEINTPDCARIHIAQQNVVTSLAGLITKEFMSAPYPKWSVDVGTIVDFSHAYGEFNITTNFEIYILASSSFHSIWTAH